MGRNAESRSPGCETMDMLEEISIAVIDGDGDKVAQLVTDTLTQGTDAIRVFNDGLSRGIKVVGEQFGRGDLFLFDLVRAAEAMKQGMGILEPKLARQETRAVVLGTFLIGTVAGDIHDIGKNIVSVMLRVAGFELVDLGVDVQHKTFVEKVHEAKPDILGLSALMSPTLPEQKKVLDALIKGGLRDQVKVMIGGAVATEEWADEIGADSYAPDAVSAVAKAKELLAP